ncbi:helix-turn-helix transcriptional regulator [Streptomyces sp. NPDC054765]
MPAPALAVVASDPITRDGAIAFFRSTGQVELLPAQRQADAEVVALFTTRVTEETLAVMRRLASESSRPDMRIVLVAECLGEAKLLRAVRYGLVGFVDRSRAGLGLVLHSVLKSREGQAELPDNLVRTIIEQIKAIEDKVLEPHGLNAAGFTERETQVLRLLAEGLDTAAVADRLNYSERAIKGIIAKMNVRLGLSNRAHAIAHAMRSGVL